MIFRRRHADPAEALEEAQRHLIKLRAIEPRLAEARAELARAETAWDAMVRENKERREERRAQRRAQRR